MLMLKINKRNGMWLLMMTIVCFALTFSSCSANSSETESTSSLKTEISSLKNDINILLPYTLLPYTFDKRGETTSGRNHSVRKR